MKKQERLCSRHVVLLGIGHTNAHVVRMWGMSPLPDTDLTCISDQTVATYSGMLPAALAGQIDREEMEIDLVRLCSSVGARLITEDVVGLDLVKKQIRFENRPAMPYDVLSIGIGSVPTTLGVDISGESLIKIKPMQTFLDRLRQSFLRLGADLNRSPRVVVVGSGVAGIEIAFCLPRFVEKCGIRECHIQIVTRNHEILPGMALGAKRRVLAELKRRGIVVSVGHAVSRVDEGFIELDDRTRIEADVVIWATGASPPSLLGKLGLPLDEHGFLATESSLLSTSGEMVFAVGDSGTIVGENLAKAGVYAVRQGPILWENLSRILDGQPLKNYRPQRSFLKLINRGDGQGIRQWLRISFAGKWVMRWKERIDSKFMKMFQPSSTNTALESMQCRGCGCKLGAEVLQSALESSVSVSGNSTGNRLTIEDSVPIGTNAGIQLVASTDFFTAPLDDAYTCGRIAALHSASDVIASGARPTTALANVAVMEGDPRAQHQSLGDFLAGAKLEFTAMGATIAGGHTIVGPRMEVGFTVIGQSLSDRLVRKCHLKEGDQLFLTKPLGIGILLASHARSRCRALDYETLLATMLWRQHACAQIAIDLGITAGTDITGFGLAGHLLEMLESSAQSATIHLEAIPALPGALNAIEWGIESSLVGDNCRVDRQIDATDDLRSMTRYRILFDPQTCGGFLWACAKELTDSFLRSYAENGLTTPTWIGEVTATNPEKKRLSVV